MSRDFQARLPKGRTSGHCGWKHRSPQRGAASLIVVMVLFFIMSLVAAYTSRNLIFEQRTSVNQYRATQAFEAAEAGLEWAIAQLNGGRIDASCLEAGATNADTSFRQRYLAINTNPPPDANSGMITAPTQPPVGAAPPAPRRAGCVWTGTEWRCSCPDAADPALVAPAGTGIFPAFWISFNTVGVSRPGVVQIIANGCTRVDAACLSSSANTSNVEGRALVTALVALKGAVATPPVAAMTVFGDVRARAAIDPQLNVFNTDIDRGSVTIQASGVVNLNRVVLGSAPGTPGSASIIPSDSQMTETLDPLPQRLINEGRGPYDRAFVSTFGIWPNTVRWQPGAVRMNCPAAGCRAALSNAVALNPDRVIWVEGDLTLETAGDIGSLPNPVDPNDPTVPGPAVVIATGNLVVPVGGVRLFGLVYTRSGNWTGGGEIEGAAITERDLAVTAGQTVAFNGALLDILRLRAGSFVRVPGGWRDFP